MRGRVSLRSIVVTSKEQVSGGLGRESAILGLEGGVCYALDDASARIRFLIQEPKAANEVRDILLEMYDVESECLLSATYARCWRARRAKGL